jgi:hypothetical protein
MLRRSEQTCGGSLDRLGGEGVIPGGFRLYWEDGSGERYYFSKATAKQAREAVKASMKELGTPDFYASFFPVTGELSDAGLQSRAEVLRKVRESINTWLARFHTSDRQIKIALIIIGELVNCLFGGLVASIRRLEAKPISLWQFPESPVESHLTNSIRGWLFRR